MRSSLLSLVLFASIFTFAACEEKPKTELDRAAYAMAESACLLFSDELALEDVSGATEEIISSYGFQDAEEIESLIDRLRGTEEENLLKIALRNAIKESCGEELQERGLDVIDMAEAMLSEE